MDTHEVLPPYRIVASPEQGVDPRTPWNLMSTNSVDPLLNVTLPLHGRTVPLVVTQFSRPPRRR
jgi:hypothetical protein